MPGNLTPGNPPPIFLLCFVFTGEPSGVFVFGLISCERPNPAPPAIAKSLKLFLFLFDVFDFVFVFGSTFGSTFG